MIYSLSHRCSIRGNNKRLLFVFLCVGCEGRREENSYIMKPWSSFFLSQKRSLSLNYYKYIIKIDYLLNYGSFCIVFHMFLERFFFSFSIKKVMHEYVLIIKYSNTTEIYRVEHKSLPSLPLPNPCPHHSDLTKKVFCFKPLLPWFRAVS